MPTTRLQSVALVGLSGAGKSSVGRTLAARLGWELVDVDAQIELAAGRPIARIFAEEGEQGFRDRESQALATALAGGPYVIATGAGIVLRGENRAMLRARCLVVWLDAPTETLVARLRAHDETRPLLAGDDPGTRLEAMRAARSRLYSEIAHLRIETSGQSHAAVARRILATLRHAANRDRSQNEAEV